MTKIDIKDPNIAPIVSDPIKKPLATGYCKVGPYMSTKVVSLRAEI